MCNSSYNLIPILLKLCRHCDHALKICMWLGYTPQINFCHLFLQFELSHFLDISNLESDLPVGGIVFHKHIFWLVMYFMGSFAFLIALQLPNTAHRKAAFVHRYINWHVWA